jgi:hypothetical protein
MHRREAGFWSKCYGLALGSLFLIAYSVGSAVGVDSTSSATYYAQVNAMVAVSATSDAINATSDAISWEIKPTITGVYTKTQILHIVANTDWSLILKDLDSSSNGCMMEWISSGYGSKRLSKPVKVSTDREVALPNTSERPIAEGKMTGSEGVDVQVTFTQEITQEDVPLLDGTIYRKVVAFVGRKH